MAFFEHLKSRAEQRARDAATVMIERAVAAYAAVPGVVTRRKGDDLLIEGRGLSRRWLTDARIRFGHWSAR